MPELSDKELRARRAAHARAQVHPWPAPRPAAQPPGDGGSGGGGGGLPGYAELHCLSNFSFQRGASSPEELVLQALEMGYAGIAITDECSVAGVVRAHMALKDHEAAIRTHAREHPGTPPPAPIPQGFRVLLGSEFRFEAGTLVAIARNLQGWGHLCEYITAARTRAPKGDYDVRWDMDELAALRECEILFAPRREVGAPASAEAIAATLAPLRAVFGERLWLAVELLNEFDDDLWLATLAEAGERAGVALVATGDVHMHRRARKPLQDVLAAVREGRTVAECGFALQGNAERHLRARLRLAQVYPDELLARTLAVMAHCHFSLDMLRKHYKYPLENVGPGETPAQTLARKTWAGAHRVYGAEVPERTRAQLVRELALIEELKYEMFFLTVEDIVAFARSKNILCQGRGSSANSAVCFCLGITAIDPEQGNLLFERFLSRERNEPPDIDVDFEHQRREEVIQYIYGKYGRDRAAIAATVICYRARSALRDVGKALGVDARLVDEFAKDHYWFDDSVLEERIALAMERSGAREDPLRVRQWLELTAQLRGFPRHLSQHVGGFVLTEDRLTRLVPVENASMKDRSVIQWEKDDLEAMGMLKVDVLALGMLSAIRRALDFMNGWRGTSVQMHEVPHDDPAVYDMICEADTVGVFQIESRAQMSMLPRLRPRCYEDLVIEVAIVRPGPIQGGMVHPYLRQREILRAGGEVAYRYPELKPALGRTLGVPIFQEQVMQIAMIAARFSADDADRLRRAMAAWKRKGGIDKFHEKLVQGMVQNGYALDFAESIYKQVLGFGDYGFPESHAASFAKLVCVSSWIKLHEPACFLAALLDSQPMGFYSPSQLVQDARRHGVRVRPVDVTRSGIDSVLESPGEALEGEDAGAPAPDPRHAARPGRADQPAVRLGLRRVHGLSEAGMARLIEARARGAFASTEDLALRAALDGGDMAALAGADALRSLSGHRRQQVWDATAQRSAPALLRGVPIHEPALALPAAPEGEEIVGDYASLGLTLRRHPLALLRPRLSAQRLLSARELREQPDGRTVRACGIVKGRQRPQTANGTLFVTLEDETGNVNVIVWSHVLDAWRDAVLKSQLLAVQGTWQSDARSEGRVQHLVATGFKDLSPLLGRLARTQDSRDFH